MAWTLIELQQIFYILGGCTFVVGVVLEVMMVLQESKYMF